MTSPPSYYSTVPRHARSSEAHGLSTGRTTWRFLTMRAFLEYCAVIMVAICIIQNAGFLRTLTDDSPPEEKARLRREWALEKSNHHLDIVRWARERADHRAEVSQWDHDRTTWRKEVAKAIQDEKRRSREAAEEFERAQQEWRRQNEAEKEEEERKREVLREAFRREREQEERERQEARDTFNREWEAEESKRQEQRKRWAWERMEEERHRKDIERRRQGVHWSEPRSNPGCSAYGTKTYVADLLDIPGDLNWQDVCYDMPIMINGQRIDRPAVGNCHRDGKGKVWATWSINFHEEQCVLYWDEMRDMGCAPGDTGMRRVEARLMNLRHGDDWDTMCKTTPAAIYGQHFDQPKTCVDENGRIGLWHLPDRACDGY